MAACAVGMRELVKKFPLLKEMTGFQGAVLAATYNIPAGETRSYRQIAVAVGKPGAVRAVGSALRKNPYPVGIPCHRVIKSNGKAGNYSGSGGTKRKIALLKEEGVFVSR